MNTALKFNIAVVTEGYKNCSTKLSCISEGLWLYHSTACTGQSCWLSTPAVNCNSRGRSGRPV